MSSSSPTLPSKAGQVLTYLDRHGSAPPGYVGGKVYKNYSGALPAGGAYREYDVDPSGPGVPRNRERIVVDDATKRAWYTPDHYATFVRMR